MEKITNGCVIQINEVGTNVYYRPGAIIGGKYLEHDCGTERSIGYFLEGLLCLAPFAKEPISIKLKGVTNHHLDPSVGDGGIGIATALSVALALTLCVCAWRCICAMLADARSMPSERPRSRCWATLESRA